MSTITYKCDVCKREIDKLENIEGLTVFSKCIITEGCKGKLYKIYRDASNIRESFPPTQEGVLDYFPRKLLYKHNQVVAAKEWRVFHDLSTAPSITVYEVDSNGTNILAQDEYTVTITNKDSVSILFSSAKRGIAHCIARSTVPVKPRLITPITNPLRATAQNTLVIAVPEIITTTTDPVNTPAPFNTTSHDPDVFRTIRIKIETTRPNEEPVVCFEEFTDTINSTAWLGWNRILVRNRRHFNLKARGLEDFRAFSGISDLTDVPNGTILRFLEIDYGDGSGDNGFRPIPSRGLFFLLSKPPYESADKVRNKLIDVGEMVGTQYDYFVYNNGELYTNETNVEYTYPDIKVAPGWTELEAPEMPVTPTIPPPPSATPVASAFVTPTPTPAATPPNTPGASVTPTVTATATVTPTVTPTQGITSTPAVTQTVTPNPSVTPTQGSTPTITPTFTSTPDVTPTQTVTPATTVTPTGTPAVTTEPTVTPTQTVTPTMTVTPSNSPPGDVITWDTAAISVYATSGDTPAPDAGILLLSDGNTQIDEGAGYVDLDSDDWLLQSGPGNGGNFELRWVQITEPEDGWLTTFGPEGTWINMGTTLEMVAQGAGGGISAGEFTVTIREVGNPASAVTKTVSLESETI